MPTNRTNGTAISKASSQREAISYLRWPREEKFNVFLLVFDFGVLD